ncbi:MAG: hypothetical protein HZC43_02345 [Nitrosomonadales bacterium]|nr:hypothetical protein [Nitrosomonadales bacterium]
MENRTSDVKPAPSAANVAQQLCGQHFGLLHKICGLAALVYFGATPASAGSQPPLAWACWISEQTPVSIKCIRDRSHLRQATEDNPEALLWNLRPDATGMPEDMAGQLPQATSGGSGRFPQAAPDEPEDEMEAGVLDQIYNKILAGDTARLDDLVEKHSSDLRKDSVWAINIHTLPLDSSWLENRPARIVKSALCRRQPSCSVILREPGR